MRASLIQGVPDRPTSRHFFYPVIDFIGPDDQEAVLSKAAASIEHLEVLLAQKERGASIYLPKFSIRFLFASMSPFRRSKAGHSTPDLPVSALYQFCKIIYKGIHPENSPDKKDKFGIRVGSQGSPYNVG